MTAKGHLLLGSALAYPPLVFFSNQYSPTELFSSFMMMLFGSLLPDIDEPQSYIGRRTLYLSDFLKLIGLKHRTLTHWLITPISIALVAYWLNDDSFSLVLFSLAFGILAHDIGDLLTKGGIQGFMFPFFRDAKTGLLPKKFRFETFSMTEMLVHFILLVINIYFYSQFLFERFLNA